MSQEKTKLGKFFAKIGDFFEGLFNAAAKTWNNLEPDIQEAMTKGSEVLALINKHVNDSPDFVIDLITKATGLDRGQLLAGLNKVSEALNVADAIEAETLEDTVKNLQKYLESVKGGTWAGITSLAAKVLAFFLAPAGTKWDTLETLMTYVYQTFIKKEK